MMHASSPSAPVRWAVSAIVVAALSGCAGFGSGLDASDKFACKAPEGVTCESVSGVYANSVQENLPSQKAARANKAKSDSGADSNNPEMAKYANAPTPGVISPRYMAEPNSGVPIRTPPLILRVWVAPWEDDAGVLFDQSLFYVTVNSGQWLIEANRNTIQSQFRPVYPLQRKVSGNAGPQPEEQPPQTTQPLMNGSGAPAQQPAQATP